MSETRKINLFVDAHCFDKEHQGTRAFIKRLYVEFSKLAPHYLIFFAAKDINNLKKELKDVAGSRFIAYKYGDTLSRLSFEIPMLIRQYKIDIAHFQYISPFIKNCRQIVTTHDVLFKEFSSNFSFFYRFSRSILFKRSLEQADLITTVSKHSKESIHRFFNIKPDEIFVVPNSVVKEPEHLHNKALSGEYIKSKFGTGPYILYVSRFEPRKNHIFLIRAFLELKLHTKGYHLVLLGHVSIKVKEVDALLDGLPADVRSCIYIHHHIPNEDLIHFYTGAELFVFPSKAEGFGLPPIEAAALGTPVICSNTTAMSDFSFFGDYHLNPDNYDVLCEKISDAISKPATPAGLQAISEEVFRRYSSKAMAQSFLEGIRQRLT